MTRRTLADNGQQLPWTTLYTWKAADSGSGVTNFSNADFTYGSSTVLQASESLEVAVNTAGSRGVSQLDLSALGATMPSSATPVFRLVVYIEDVVNVEFISVQFATDGTFSDRYTRSWTFNGTVISANTAVLVDGWNILEASGDEFSVAGSPSWASISHIRVNVDAKAGETCTAYIEGIYHSGRTRPVVVFAFDDGFESVNDVAIPILEAAGFKAQMYVSRQYSDYSVRADDGTYMSPSIINSLLAKGHKIGVHGDVWSSYGTKDALKAEIEAEIAWFNSNGWSEHSNHCAYTQGRHESFIYDAVNELGFLSARTQRGGGKISSPNTTAQFVPFTNWLRQGGTYTPADGEASTDMIARINQAVSTGGVLELVFHVVKAANGYHTADFQAVVDHIRNLSDQGLVDVFTKSELYDKYS